MFAFKGKNCMMKLLESTLTNVFSMHKTYSYMKNSLINVHIALVHCCCMLLPGIKLRECIYSMKKIVNKEFVA